VIRDAFKKESTVKFVDRVRREVDVCLSLVALEGDTIVGHILFATLPFSIDGRKLNAAYLACAAVTTSQQNKGIGSRLIRAGLEELKQRGIEAVLVLGHPTYYPRFGFSSQLAKKIHSPWQGKEAFMALELVLGSLNGESGMAEYHPLYTED